MGHIYLRMAALWPVSAGVRALLLFIGCVVCPVRLKRFCVSQNNQVQLGSVFARHYQCGCVYFSLGLTVMAVACLCSLCCSDLLCTELTWLASLR